MDLVKEFVENNLADELMILSGSTAHLAVSLNVYEKTLIYKYSDDGFLPTNKLLLNSKGIDFDDFGILLYTTLSKLPDFRGIVYRKVFLTPAELYRYTHAWRSHASVKEYPFISTSKFISIALLWAGLTHHNPNCLFVIYTKTGKEIELMSKFTNEREVLLKPNTQFNVLNIFAEPDFIQITMEEV